MRCSLAHSEFPFPCGVQDAWPTGYPQTNTVRRQPGLRASGSTAREHVRERTGGPPRSRKRLPAKPPVFGRGSSGV